MTDAERIRNRPAGRMNGGRALAEMLRLAGAESAIANPGPIGNPGVSLRGKGAAALVVDQEMPHA